MDTVISKLLENKEENHIFPFLWMHGENEETIRKYMNVIYNANIRAVCIESRPHPDFCGPRWWKDMDIILEEAKKLGMKIWILDDSHFPTGYANGAMKDEPDELCRQSLVYQELETVVGGNGQKIRFEICENAQPWEPNLIEKYQLPEEKMRHYDDDRIISITAVKSGGISEEDIIDITDQAEKKSIDVCLPPGKWKIGICYLTRNRGPHRDYINMLDKRSCRILIDAVYEPHYRHYKDEFGKTIAGFFSDEPELGNGHLYDTGKRIFELDDQPWSKEVEDTLRRKWKTNFEKYLPLLWIQDFSDNIKAKIRYDFMDTVTRTVKEDFSMQIGDWCRARGVEYIGHIIEDNNQHTRTGSSLGHYFRGLAGQDMAGIDDIGDQVLPQGEWEGPYGMMGEYRDGKFYHYTLGKLASSMAAVEPLKKGRSMCEIFGNYGWEEGVKLEKYLTDHFLVRGINHYVPHAFSPKEFPDPDCPPHFYAHGHNPQYRHFGALMKYMNRMCNLISGGRHIALVAILYNAESEWTGDYMDLQKPAELLADRQIDYDFVPADVFEEREKYGTKTEGVLQINNNRYSVFLIPESQFIPYETAKAAVQLNRSGGRVYFINRIPEGSCEGRSLPDEIGMCSVIPLEKLGDIFEKEKIGEFCLQPADNRIRCLHYSASTERYLFVNEGTKTYEGTIRVPSSGFCFQYDAWENRLLRVEQKNAGQGTLIRATIEPGKSFFIIFDTPDTIPEEPEQITKDAQKWNKGWVRSICQSTDYPLFTDEKEVNLPDHLEKEKPLFSGFVRYEKKYCCECEPDRMLLEITDASEGVEVFVNGETAGIQITAPYRYDLTPLIRRGENCIRIEVATTLERERSAEPDPVREYLGLEQKVPTCPSGINGEVLCMIRQDRKIRKGRK